MNESASDGSKMQLARILRALASLVEKLSSEEIYALLNTDASFARTEVRKETAAPQSNPAIGELSELANRLHGLNSREDGAALLTSASLTRKDLEKLGRLIGIPLMKSDNMERLQEKIIEASIGSRLSSEAIRGDRKNNKR